MEQSWWACPCSRNRSRAKSALIIGQMCCEVWQIIRKDIFFRFILNSSIFGDFLTLKTVLGNKNPPRTDGSRCHGGWQVICKQVWVAQGKCSKQIPNVIYGCFVKWVNEPFAVKVTQEANTGASTVYLVSTVSTAA